MTGLDPRGAPPRTDLPWLRHRAGSRAATGVRYVHPGASSAPAAAPASGKVDYTRPGRSSAPTPAPASTPRIDVTHHDRAPRPAPSAPPADSSLDLSGPAPASAPPAGSSSLDLSGPAPATPPASAAPSGSSSLDLGRPASAPSSTPAPSPMPSTPAPDGGSLLDLGGATRPAAPRRPVPPPGPPRRRIAAGERVLLAGTTPTLTLTRLQSGVGALTIEAVTGLGDLRLGAAYALTDGTTSVVADLAGQQTAPPGSARPVLTAGRGRYETLTVDLRQSRALSRLAVLGLSATGAQLDWDGTLVVTTYAGGRMEVPLDLGPWQGPVVLLSLYAVDGEYVLRAERQRVDGSLRDACVAYGYDRITWADDSTPVA